MSCLIRYHFQRRSMKVNNIQNYNVYANSSSNGLNKTAPQKTQNTPSFKGDAMINFWDAVARGGFAASFTIQDMTGTNIPRTWQALQRNKDITGEYNYKAAAEVAIREFLTGPSMCIIPMFVLALSKKYAGSANDVPLRNIEAFTEQMRAILIKDGYMDRVDLDFPKTDPPVFAKGIKQKFYERMFALSLNEDVIGGAEPSDNAKKLAGLLVDYDNAPKRGVLKQFLNRDLKEKITDGSGRKKGDIIKAKDQIYDEIVSLYTDAKKTVSDDFGSLLSTNLKGTLKGEDSILTLIKDFSNFGNDVQKTMIKDCSRGGSVTTVNLDFEPFMDSFKKLRVGSKFITNILMVVLTGLFMMNIPKLYTLHKTNPETDAFRNKEGEVVRADK